MKILRAKPRQLATHSLQTNYPPWLFPIFLIHDGRATRTENVLLFNIRMSDGRPFQFPRDAFPATPDFFIIQGNISRDF